MMRKVITQAALLALVVCSFTIAYGRDLHTTNSRAISLYEQGLELAENERFNEALEKLKAAIGEDEQFLEAHLRYMDAFRGVGRGEEVADMYSNMLKQNPDSPLFNFLYGRTLSDFGEKRAAFRKALALDSTFYYAQYGIGGTYMLEGRLDEAIVALNKALSLNPRMMEALKLMGQIYMDKGMPLQAKSILEQALAVDSLNVQVLVGLGQAFGQMERYESAEKMFSAAIAIEPEDPLLYYFLGLVYEISGQSSKAADMYNKFLKIAPDNEMAGSVKRMIEKLQN